MTTLSRSEITEGFLAELDDFGELIGSLDDAAWNGPVNSDYPGTLADGILALWYDGYLHADDIRSSLAMPSARGAGLRASVHHVADNLEDRSWGPATLALDGMEVRDVRGGGEKVTGDSLTFVLVATGRADPSTIGLDETANIYG